MWDSIPSKETIENTHERIKPFIHNTPVLTCQAIDEIAQANIYFKCENFQKIGAFKFRGATNALLSLSNEEKQNGVVTHSSGNHAQALALAAKMNDSKAYIVMPENAPAVKRNAVLGYGAEVITCKPTLQAREETSEKVMQETGATFIHPYNDYRIIAGQATSAKELIETTDKLDYIIAPVGGGGLLSGTSLSAHYFSPNTKVIATEPEGADDAYRSFKGKALVPSENPNTICDGLLTSLGTKTFDIILKHVHDIYTTNDEEIIAAMRLVWERMKIIIEPSSAVTLAIVIKNPQVFAGSKIGIIFSGGNVDLGKLPF